MNSRLEIIEIQGTAEKQSFSRNQLDQMSDIESQDIKNLLSIQEKILEF